MLEANSWAWIPDEKDMFMPGKILKSFRMGEEGKCKYEDGRVSFTRPRAPHSAAPPRRAVARARRPPARRPHVGRHAPLPAPLQRAGRGTRRVAPVRARRRPACAASPRHHARGRTPRAARRPRATV